MAEQPQVIVAGRGRLGSSLAGAIGNAGYRLSLLPGRGPELEQRLPTEPGSRALVLLAIPDDAVTGRARELSDALRTWIGDRRQLAFVHTSGVLDLQSLEPVRELGHPVGSFHPLQSFATEQPPSAFAGVMVAIDASGDELLQQLERLARDLDSRPRQVTVEARGLYHAGAVMAANYLVALADEAAGVLEAAGWPRQEALADLLPLMQGTLDNLRRLGAEGALTGPIRRGDVATLRRNLSALERESPKAAAGYRILGLAALELAERTGLERAASSQIRKALTE